MKAQLIPDALNEEECQRLITECSGHLTRAMFWTKGERVFDRNVRDAYNYKWQDAWLSGVSRSVVEKFSSECVDLARIEPPEIVCYPPGNGMERHLDGPHRSHSLVFFLNSGYQGGELVFDGDHAFKNVPVGSVVIWENNAESWHASAPIIKGFKWILVSWVRRVSELGREEEVHARIKAESN